MTTPLSCRRPTVSGTPCVLCHRFVREVVALTCCQRPCLPCPLTRLHLAHVLEMPNHVCSFIAATERDADDTTKVAWIPRAEVPPSLWGLHRRRGGSF